jgi:hypothetical protein
MLKDDRDRREELITQILLTETFRDLKRNKLGEYYFLQDAMINNWITLKFRIDIPRLELYAKNPGLAVLEIKI